MFMLHTKCEILMRSCKVPPLYNSFWGAAVLRGKTEQWSVIIEVIKLEASACLFWILYWILDKFMFIINASTLMAFAEKFQYLRDSGRNYWISDYIINEICLKSTTKVSNNFQFRILTKSLYYSLSGIIHIYTCNDNPQSHQQLLITVCQSKKYIYNTVLPF